eukprot:4183025-Alexandrium_andersonii.AAC.1
MPRDVTQALDRGPNHGPTSNQQCCRCCVWLLALPTVEPGPVRLNDAALAAWARRCGVRHRPVTAEALKVQCVPVAELDPSASAVHPEADGAA